VAGHAGVPEPIKALQDQAFLLQDFW
jgi:hypothetical protein